MGREHCTITVRNQGPGILDSERIRLFQDFGRASTKPTGGEPSTGLGLAICYKILPARGGSIRADNRPEAGAAFRITFALPI
jgi:signal transduction histidine kinase